MSLKNISHLSQIPNGFCFTSHDLQIEGLGEISVSHVSLLDNYNVGKWNKDNLIFHDVVFINEDGKAKVLSCGLKKAFHIGEREDLVCLPPNIGEWRLYSNSYNKFILNFYKEKPIIRPLNYVKFQKAEEQAILQNVKYLPEKFVKEFKNKNDYSFIFETCEYGVKLFTIVDNSTGQPYDPTTVDSIARDYGLLRPSPLFLTDSKSAILQFASETARNYILLKGASVIICNNQLYSEIALGKMHENEKKIYNALVQLWIKYDFKNYNEIFDHVKYIIENDVLTLKLVGILSTANLFLTKCASNLKKAFSLMPDKITEKQRFISSIRNKNLIRMAWSISKSEVVNQKQERDFLINFPNIISSFKSETKNIEPPTPPKITISRERQVLQRDYNLIHLGLDY